MKNMKNNSRNAFFSPSPFPYPFLHLMIFHFILCSWKCENFVPFYFINTHTVCPANSAQILHSNIVLHRFRYRSLSFDRNIFLWHACFCFCFCLRLTVLLFVFCCCCCNDDDDAGDGVIFILYFLYPKLFIHLRFYSRCPFIWFDAKKMKLLSGLFFSFDFFFF